MKIAITENNGAKVLAISGDIDMFSSPQLRKELLGLIDKKAGKLIVDFRDVTYIDSSGIATFVEGLKGVMVYGGKLRFASIPAGIMEIFSFSKLDKVFQIYDSIEDALNS